jgi:hypothetical protein
MSSRLTLVQFLSDLVKNLPSPSTRSEKKAQWARETARKLYTERYFVPHVATKDLLAPYLEVVTRWSDRAAKIAAELGLDLDPSDPWTFKTVALAALLNAVAIGLVEQYLTSAGSVKIPLLRGLEKYTGCAEVTPRQLTGLIFCGDNATETTLEYTDCVIRQVKLLAQAKTVGEVSRELRSRERELQLPSESRRLVLAVLRYLCYVD